MQAERTLLSRSSTQESTPVLSSEPLHRNLSRFSILCNEIVINRVRNVFHNGRLAEYLDHMNQIAESFDKRGIVFLVNDNAKDAQNRNLLQDNHNAAHYLSLLGNNDLEAIMKLNIPESYKAVAKKIIHKNVLEIRSDYVHSSSYGPHFGSLDIHLMNLAYQLKDPLLPDQETFLYFDDIDTKHSRHHYHNIQTAFYDNPHMLVNFSAFDFPPDIHENPQGQDISKDLLLYLDNYRLYRFAHSLDIALFGGNPCGIPSISGRFSYFFQNGRIAPFLEHLLERARSNDDYVIGSFARRGQAFTPAVGYHEEVYFPHRATTTDAPFDSNIDTDSERAFLMVSQKNFVLRLGKQKYDMLSSQAVNELIAEFERRIATPIPNTGFYLQRVPSFKDHTNYRDILAAETRKEQAKVRRRKQRLIAYIESLAYGLRLEPAVERTVAPYVQYFPEEIDLIQHMLTQGSTTQQIADHIARKKEYKAFFAPSADLHKQIAQLRALNRYVVTHGISEHQEWRHLPLNARYHRSPS